MTVMQHIDYDSIAEIYDLYVNANYDIPFFLSEIKPVQGPILELMAGTGRLSLPLIESGAKLMCVDSSSAMLDVLSRKLQQRGLHAEVVCADVCQLSLSTQFELAIRRKQVDGLLRLVGQFPTEGGTLIESGFEQGGNPVVSRQQFFEFFDSDGRLLEKRLLQMKFAFVEKDEFEQMAQDAGFRIAQLYGSYDRAPFDPAQSPVMIWRFEKD